MSIESCVLYVLCAGFAGRTDKRAGIAGAIVAGETLVVAANGFRCPLTALAERYGARNGSGTDIYLPKWFAHNMPGHPHAAAHPHDLPACEEPAAVAADSQERVAQAAGAADGGVSPAAACRDDSRR
jgi:hypothetical protein